MAASANGDSGWLSAKSSCRSTVSRDPAALLVRLGQPLDHAAGQQRPVDGDGPADVARAARPRSSWLSVSRCRIAANASPGRSMTLSSMAWLTAKLDLQRLGLGRDQPLEGRLAPGHEALRRLLAHHLAPLLRVVARLGQGRARSRPRARAPARPRCPTVSKPARPGPPGDLVELAGLQQPGPGPVVLGQRGEQHGADRHVDADAEGVGAADDLEQAGLGQRLDQPPVLGQHARVVHADAVPDQPGQRLAEAGGEPEVADQSRRSRPSRRGCTR